MTQNELNQIEDSIEWQRFYRVPELGANALELRIPFVERTAVIPGML